MVDLAGPAFAEFGLNRLAPLDDRHRVGVVVGVQQSEAGAIVEAASEVDGLDAEVKTVKRFEKLSGDIADGATRDDWRTASVYPTTTLRSRTHSPEKRLRRGEKPNSCTCLLSPSA